MDSDYPQQAPRLRSERGGVAAHPPSVSGVLHLIRHASAGDRGAWQGDDSARPLDLVGHAQADAIAATLAAAPIRRVLSSPSLRCTQTIQPLAAELGLEIEMCVELAEGAAGWRTEALVARLCGETSDSVLCSHGDVIPEVLWRLAQRGIDVNPTRCKKASIWELHVIDGAVSSGVYRSPRSIGARLGS